jgi:hypothetical protein
MFGAKGHPILVSLVDGETFSDDMFPFFLGVSVADPDPFDTDPDPAFHFDTDPDPAFSFDTDPDPTV